MGNKSDKVFRTAVYMHFTSLVGHANGNLLPHNSLSRLSYPNTAYSYLMFKLKIILYRGKLFGDSEIEFTCTQR